MHNVDLLVVGGPVPSETEAALTAASIDIRDRLADRSRLEGWDRRTVDVVLAIPPAGDPTEFVADVLEAVPGIPVVMVGPVEGSLPGDLLEPGVLEYVRQPDLYEHGELVAHRIRSVLATARNDGTRPEDGRHDQFEQAANALTATAETTTATDLDLEERLDRLLSTGAEEFGFPIGYVTRIESGTQEILAATGDHEAIQPGTTDPLGDTCCRRTIESDRPVVLEDALEDGWADDPANERFALRCYVGARIVVDGEMFGTVCFADERPRDGLEGDVYQSTVKAFAQRIGYEIERHRYEAELEDREERFQALLEHAPDGIVIHDETGNVVDVNQTLVENLGYDRDELLSMNVVDFEVGFDQAVLREAWEETDEQRPLKVEGTHRRKDGSTYPVEVWVSRKNHLGESRFMAICRDITDRKERERQLRRFEAFLESSPTMMTLLNTDGTVLLDKTGIEDDWRHPPEEFLETNVMEYVHPDDHDRVTAVFEELRENPGKPMTVEFRFRGRDDTWRWIRTSAVNHTDDPLIGGIIAISIEVTEQKRRERDLERYEHLWNHLPVGVCRIDPTGDGAFVEVNDMLVEIAGAESREELLAHSVMDLWADEAEQKLLIEQVMETGRETVERRFETLDGRTVWLRLVVMARDDSPSIDVVVQDVTDRRQREIHLEKAQEVGDIGWWHKDLPSDVIYWSEQISEMWGADGEVGLVDHDVFMEFIHPEDEEFVESAWEAAKAGEPYDIEHRIVTGDGETRWMREKAELTFDEDGQPVSVVGIVQDVTDRKKRERELERHRAYLESATDMSTLIDPDGTIEYVSPAVERVLGWDPAELIGENGFEYVHPDDREDRIDDIEALVEGRKDETVLEFRFQRADGSYCWIEATARDLLADPDIDGILLSSRDVTDRKEHERQITALHDATRELIDAESKAAVAAIAIEAATDLLDFSLPSVWFPEGDELVVVANSEDHQRLLEEAGTPDPSHPRGSWAWDVFEDGETVVKNPIARERLAADVPLHSAIVLPIGSHGIFACATRGSVEFTDRQVRVAETLARNVRVALDQLEQRSALERQTEFVDDLLDAIEDVVYVLDTDGDLQMWNAAFEEVTGYESDEIASMNATEFFAGDDVEAAAAAIEGAFETGRTRVELDFRSRDGEAIPYEFIANAFEDPDGEPVMAGSGRDRTLHVEYEQRLEEQRDRLNLLNQVVRHDVRNDMQVVHGRAHLLEDHVDDDGKKHLREVIQATEEAIELTKTARDLTETMLREEEDLKPISLDRELRSQLEEIRSQHDDAVIRTDGRLPTVDVQADEMLEAVFRNLLQNAIIHNDKEVPEVTIDVERDDDAVSVHVADNGPGIPDTHKEDVFGKGEKGLDSPGTGLGLYLVRTLVENYDGSVWVEDNDPEGAVFVVELPLVA